MQVSKSKSKSKRATKSFSGCWTCRKRHVKCDQAVPSCARCKKAGFACHGYGIKLVWIDPHTGEWEQKIRRIVQPSTIYRHDFIRVDVQRACDLLDQSDATSVGPFSVFPVQEPAESAIEDSSLALESDVSDVESLDTSSNTLTDGDECTDSVDAVVSSLWSQTTTGTSSLAPTAVYRHLDLLPRPSEQRELIHHWIHFVCWHLVPVDRPDNPFRSVLTPMAIAGASSVSHESNGEVALFHSLCATSAFSRGQILNDTRALTLARKHYHLAMVHLRHSLANLSSEKLDVQRDSIIATITIFSVMDMITGRSSEWRTHFEGGVSFLVSVADKIFKCDRSSSMIYQSYLAIAALCNIDLPFTTDEMWNDCQHYVLDRFFGLTRPILQHIVMMNSLLKDTANAGQDPAVLDDLESRLLAQTAENLDLKALTEPRAQELARHHASVFHFASLIHFYRTARQTAPSELQGLVTQAVEYLEEIERLGADTVGCTLIWPPLIIACECLDPALQARILAWYQLKRRHGFRNLEISKEVAQEVWRRREQASGETDIHWKDILADLDIDIVLA